MARKQPAPLTFEERLISAQTTAAAAVSVFENIAKDLESSAVEKKALASDIYTEVDRLRDLIEDYLLLADEAEEHAESALTKAASVRALVGN